MKLFLDPRQAHFKTVKASLEALLERLALIRHGLLFSMSRGTGNNKGHTRRDPADDRNAGHHHHGAHQATCKRDRHVIPGPYPVVVMVVRAHQRLSPQEPNVPPGKALLAFLPAEQVSRVLSGALTRFTDTTITDLDALTAELAATRARGYGVCAGELESSLYGVSAPVLDRNRRSLAVLSIWGPQDRVKQGEFAELGAVAIRAAAEISSARPSGEHWVD